MDEYTVKLFRYDTEVVELPLHHSEGESDSPRFEGLVHIKGLSTDTGQRSMVESTLTLDASVTISGPP